MNERKKGDYLYLGAAVLASLLIICLAFIIRDSFPGQKYAFAYGDFYIQYYPICKNFWRVVFEQGNPTFSFSYSMGLPTAALYACVAMSPVGILLYFIDDIEVAAFVVFAVKIMLSTACFWIYSQKELKAEARVGMYYSVAYTLSAYTMTFYVNTHFLDALYITPLLMICLLRFLRGKGKRLLVLVYAYSFINMFLTGYYIGIVSFVIYLFLLWYSGAERKKVLKSIADYFLVVVAAALISMVVILPAAVFVMTHMQGGSSFSAIPLISLFELPRSFFVQLSHGSIFNLKPAIYCGWPCLILTVFYFIDKKNPLKEKIAFGGILIFLIICMVWHPAYLMMHAFDEPDSFAWRFSFLFIFVLVSVACREYNNISKNEFVGKKYIGYTTYVSIIMLSIFYSIIKYKDLGELLDIFVINIGFILFSAILLFRKHLLVYGLLEVFVSAVLFVPDFSDNNELFQQEHRKKEARVEAFLDGIKKNDSADPFYRIALEDEDFNDFSMLYDYRSISFFASIEDTVLWQTMYRLGSLAHAQQITEWGGTEFKDMIFSVRYRLTKEDLELGRYSINKYMLPLAFCVSDRVLDYTAESDPFSNQNSLASAMTGKDRCIFKQTNALWIPGEGIELSTKESGEGYQLIKSGEDSTLIWSVDTPGNQKAYSYCLKNKLSVAFGEQNYLISGMPGAFGDSNAMPITMGCILPMYRLENMDKSIVTLYMTGQKGSTAEFDDMLFAYYDDEELEAVYNELAAGGIEINEIYDGYVSGSILADKTHSIVFTSIPYDPSWEILVDGVKTESFAILGGTFLATRVDEGQHEIQFVYTDNMFRTGEILSLIGLMILMLLGTKSVGILQKDL